VKAGQVGQNGQVDLECGVETAQRFEPTDEVVYSETPSGMTVTRAHVGPYAGLGASHRAVTEWSRNNGHRLTGICWEIYGDYTEASAQLRTEIFYQVRP
jgi:effector-binding domain-containing protein